MGAKILVVDDSRFDLHLVEDLLSVEGSLEFVPATTVDQAEALLRDDPPQVVVTDLIMPERDGLDLLRTVVRDHPFIPVVVITGKGSEQTAVEALEAGAASYVPKNLLTQRLVETIQHVQSVAREEESQHKLMGCMTESHCEFVLENDPAMIPALVNFIHRSVRTVGLCEDNEGIRICVALEEAVNNALFHGNLELESEMRESDPTEYRDLLQRRRAEDPYQSRRVHVDVELSRDRGKFVITDDGPGFDPASLPNPTAPEQIEKASGRGLLLIRTFMDEVQFNDVGNVITLTKFGIGVAG